MESLLRSLKRFGRGTVGIMIMGGIAYANKDVRYIALVPVLSMIDKFLRDKFKVKYIPF